MTERLPERVDTLRLVLRLWHEEDADALGQAITESAEHLRPWMAWIEHEPVTPEQRRAMIREWRAAWADGGDATYGVFLDGVPIGGTGLHRRDDPHSLDIGYWLHVDHVGQGYATELAEALTATGLAQPGITTIRIQHHADNVASEAVPRRLGFERVDSADDADESVTWVTRG